MPEKRRWIDLGLKACAAGRRIAEICLEKGEEKLADKLKKKLGK